MSEQIMLATGTTLSSFLAVTRPVMAHDISVWVADKSGGRAVPCRRYCFANAECAWIGYDAPTDRYYVYIEEGTAHD